MIQTERLGYAYQTEREDEKPLTFALDDVSLSVADGEYVAILGRNGSGKSTLAKHLNALLLPLSGRVLIDGIDTADAERLWDVRQRVGMVFQNPDNQIVASVVEEDVAFAPENLGVPPEEIRLRVDDALRQVGMYEYRTHAPHLLSGGQKQRVAIAGVIAMRPRCIVLDEATAMLDPAGRREVMETARRLNREGGITVVNITHNMDEAVQADRVVVIDGGRIRMDGTPREIFSRVSELRRLGLDVPQVTSLAHRLRRAGIDVPEDVLTVEECADALENLLR